MNIFKRIELKYRLADGQHDELLKKIGPYIKEDVYFESTVLNIYFDTEHFDIISQCLDKPMYKGKIRLRSYNVPTLDDDVFFELKFKYKGTVGKRRVRLRLGEYYDYLQTGKYPDCEKQIMDEIDNVFQLYALRPKMAICYDRRCYCGKDNEGFRITFDKNIRYRENDLRLENGSGGGRLFDEDVYIMELKTLDAMPLWMVHALSDLKIYPTSFSKYGKIYERRKGKHYV